MTTLRHVSKFQRVSSACFVTAPTSLNGGQPNFARRLAFFWAGTLYIHFWGLLPADGILPCAKFTLRPSLAFSYIGALRHGSQAVGVSQTLPRGTIKNGIPELSLLVIFNRGRHLYSKGGDHVGHRPTWVSGFGFVIAPTTLNGGQSNFARCLAVYWAGTLYVHFRGLLAPKGILPRAKFILRPGLAFSYIGSVTARHSSSGHQPNFPAFSRRRHLYLAGRPSCWAHILVLTMYLYHFTILIILYNILECNISHWTDTYLLLRVF